MEIMFFGIIYIITMIFKFIGAILFIIWKFEFNPVIEEGTKNGYLYKPWNYTLYDWLFYGNKPEHRGIN